MKNLSKILLIALFGAIPLFASDNTTNEEPKPSTETPAQTQKDEIKDEEEVLVIPADEIDLYDDEGNLIKNEEAVG
jgi:hypothetical protein